MPYAQTMIFSATMPKYIQEIALRKMKSPLLIDLVGEETNQIPDRIKNICVVCNESEKHDILEKYIT